MVVLRSMSRCLLKYLSQDLNGFVTNQPVLVQKIYMLDIIHHHRVDCSEARGAALTKMVETDDEMIHYMKDMFVGRMICITVRFCDHDTMLVFPTMVVV